MRIQKRAFLAALLTICTVGSVLLLGSVGAGFFGNTTNEGNSFGAASDFAQPWIFEPFDAVDTAKWNGFANGNLSVTAGNLEIALSNQYPSITSNRLFDLNNNSFEVGVASVPNIGNHSTSATMTAQLDGNNRWSFGWTDGAAFLERVVAGVQTQDFAIYPDGTNRWRIRHAAPNISFEMSADGTSWQTIFSRPDAEFDTTALRIQLTSGHWNTEPDPGVTRYSEVVIGRADVPVSMPSPNTAAAWSEEFDALDMASSANPNGFWRANDVWQDIDNGYAGFDGPSSAYWNLNPNQSLGGAFRSPFSLSNSVLTVSAQRTPSEWAGDIAASNANNGGAVPPWSGGILISNTNRSDARFGTGYYEFRARIPNPAKGAWPALWLFGANGYNPGKENAEIDVLEVFGYPSGQPWSITLHQKQFSNGAVSPSSGASTENGEVYVATVNSDTTGWHVYALDWQPTYLRFYQDNVLMAQVTGDDAAYFADVKMSLRLDFAMDAAFFPPNQRSDASTPDVLSMDVDYIRRWDTRPY